MGVKEEIRSLLAKIKNIRSSVQKSAAGLSSPSIWEINCLNAVQRCAKSWASAVKFHGDSKYIMSAESETSRNVALSLFEIVQMAIQSGPLSGAKPGYFKRCGGDVARVALRFLRALPADARRDLRFTEKQVLAIGKWISNAEKASLVDDPPSRAMGKKPVPSKSS